MCQNICNGSKCLWCVCRVLWTEAEAIENSFFGVESTNDITNATTSIKLTHAIYQQFETEVSCGVEGDRGCIFGEGQMHLTFYEFASLNGDYLEEAQPVYTSFIWGV